MDRSVGFNRKPFIILQKIFETTTFATKIVFTVELNLIFIVIARTARPQR